MTETPDRPSREGRPPAADDLTEAEVFGAVGYATPTQVDADNARHMNRHLTEENP
ncbi:hypothetical protein J7F02_05845 [Streptomyces sp. ISL-112]|uniref:hypothetical protein n=1 Tax=unclassified Streptomyces TaxID=2593676 RepID=UPI001BE7A11E|nr:MULTISPECIES: hypothetical protein [unclassified Streptomyces]MBT2425219.1 hypothetical protein [Streptomyces sp. ISL-112]MBT2462010.1 hypothetical protein [Streptomyces sp. ISL-63]